MKKNMIRWIAGLSILLVLYILVAFLIPFVHTAVFWVSFVFTLIAFAVVAASIYIAFIKNPDAKSRFYGFPIAKLIRSPWIADGIYLLMKPLEWLFLAVLYAVDLHPEDRIAVQYTGKSVGDFKNTCHSEPSTPLSF